MSGFIPPLSGKLGDKKLFTGEPIELPLGFLLSHDYVIELEGDYVLRFKSLHCAARSSLHYQKPVIDQTTRQIYSWEECRRIVDSLKPPDDRDAWNRRLNSAQTSTQLSPVLRSHSDFPRR